MEVATAIGISGARVGSRVMSGTKMGEGAPYPRGRERLQRPEKDVGGGAPCSPHLGSVEIPCKDGVRPANG